MHAEPVSVMVADDHPMIVQGLRDLIAGVAGLRFAGDASDGQEAVATFMRVRPDIVLLDVQMPHLDGIEATRRIRAIDRNARVIVLTSFGGEEDIRQALQAGAMGYLLKSAPRCEVLACIAAVAAGRKYLMPEVSIKLASWFSSSALSARELEILGLLAHGHCNKTIARSAGITEGTVKSHLKHIFGKLGVSSRTAAVNSAIRRGVVKIPC